MLSCNRCGSSYDEMAVASIGSCPRCRGRDGVTTELESDLSSTPSASSEPDEGVGAGEASEPAP
jgi:hypothetical protein